MASLMPSEADIPTTSTPPPLTELPPSDSPDLYVSPTSTTLEYMHTWHLNGDEWRGPLTNDQYFLREQKLLNQDLARGTITAWILTSDNLPRSPDGARPILASCETLLKHGYVAHNGSVQNVRAHGIASVFNRKEYRGRGYATRMIAELAKQLDTYQQPPDMTGSFSILYSDIGKTFYSRHGWKAYASTHIHLPPLRDHAYSELLQTSRLQNIILESLSSEDVSNLSTSLTQSLLSNLSTLTASSPNTIFVSIAPDSAHFAWHFAREEIQASYLDLPHGVPRVKGAMHKDTGTALIWARVYAAKPQHWQLHILYVVLPQMRAGDGDGSLQQEERVEEVLGALLARAQLEAGEWDMTAGLEIWNPSEVVVRAAQRLRKDEEGKVHVVERDREHICSLRWNGKDTEEQAGGEVVWVANEKYAWC